MTAGGGREELGLQGAYEQMGSYQAPPPLGLAEAQTERARKWDRLRGAEMYSYGQSDQIPTRRRLVS